MRATKGNREYIINDAQMKTYQDAGFDIFSDSGEQIGHGLGKTIPYETHAETVKELEHLKGVVAKMNAKESKPKNQDGVR